MRKVELPLAVADEIHEDLGQMVSCEMRTSYSGRGMRGESCLGFVTDHVDQLAFCLGVLMAEWQPRCTDAWDEVATEWLIDAFRRSATDNMGTDFIIYWPDIKVVP